tara:strand:- start:1936 stop:2151 length:216 start_codon:yes stop_codon:yes gene_type:complete
MSRVKDMALDDATEVWSVLSEKIKNAEHVDELPYIIDYVIREARVNPLVGEVHLIQSQVKELWNEYWSDYL